jgi:cell wall-associated NlpC family hydrolase
MELTGDSLDAIRVKAVFYCLYFGTDFEDLGEGFYTDFVDAFTETAGENLSAVQEPEVVYANLSALIGRPITDTDKANINNLYFQIKYGYAVNDANPGIPGEAFDDENFAALMAEATKYIGYPYVWGGSKPSESFDCSGFVCWSYTESGVYDLPRTTAQGIYNQCALVSEEEVKPGDLAFFTETYESVNPVTHVGIIVGESLMLHCGDPIGYADLTESYYRSHFYGYGRLNIGE